MKEEKRGIDIGTYVYELLQEHDCVVVPNFGGFVSRDKDAVIQPVQNLFVPPTRTIVFNGLLTHNDGLLLHHIACREELSYETVAGDIQQQVNDFLYQLYCGERVVFQKVGSFVLKNKRLEFTAEPGANIQDEHYGLVSFMVPMVQRNATVFSTKSNAPSYQQHGERKRSAVIVRSISVAASVILIAGIAAYFLHFRMESNFNLGMLFPKITSLFEKGEPAEDHCLFYPHHDMRYYRFAENPSCCVDNVVWSEFKKMEKTTSVEILGQDDFSALKVNYVSPEEKKPEISTSGVVEENRMISSSNNTSHETIITDDKEKGSLIDVSTTSEEEGTLDVALQAPTSAAERSTTTEKFSTSVKKDSKRRYHIIGASYLLEKNAAALCEEIREKGFQSSVLPAPEIGRYRVSYGFAENKDAALTMLSEIRQHHCADAWLLIVR